VVIVTLREEVNADEVKRNKKMRN